MGLQRHMLVQYRWISSVIGCRAYNGAQTGSEHGLDNAMVCARPSLCIRVAHLSNPSSELDTAKLETTALKNLPLELRNCFKGLELNEDVWRELTEMAAEASVNQ